MELVSSENVVHEVSVKVKVHEDSIFVNIRGQELGMDGVGTTVSTYIKVVPLYSGNHSEILSLGFITFTDATRDITLELVRERTPL